MNTKPRRVGPEHSLRGQRLSRPTEISGPAPHRAQHIYVAGSLTLLDDPELRQRRLSQVQERFPAAVLIDSLIEFTGLADWLERWPRIVRRIDGLVFMADGGGAVGAGTVKELMDAVVHRVPVVFVTDAGFVPLAALSLRPLPHADAWRAVTVEVRAV